MKWFPKIIYSVGIRCTTEIAISEAQLKKILSLLGSANMKIPSNINSMLLSNLNHFFNFKNHYYFRFNKCMKNLNSKYGHRTFIDIFDDPSNYHEASLPHHDLSQVEILGHFRRGIKRLEYIKANKVDILFIYSVNAIEGKYIDAFNVRKINELFYEFHNQFNCSTIALISTINANHATITVNPPPSPK